VGRTDGGKWRAALFSRTLDEITHGYPEVVAALVALLERGWRAEGGAVTTTPPSALHPSPSLILDGELLAYEPADPRRARSFKQLQRRLGRKTLTPEMLAEVPVQLVVYDVLAVDGALVVDESYAERRARLERAPWPGDQLRLAPARPVSTAAEVDAAFDAARAAGNEGVIAKDYAAPYTPGRRGKSWIKLKKATETLDVVITGAEWGHGRRAKVLSDYTFAVRASESDPTLLNVGKAYNGLTDAEIAELTVRLQALTVQRFGRYQQVRPEVVLEVTFDYVQASGRHKAGYALRFPRILRVRDDKPASEVDTLDRVRTLAGVGGA
jgi:DNA ligase-1